MNEATKTVLNFFFFFYQKVLHAPKSTKKHKKYKKHQKAKKRNQAKVNKRTKIKNALKKLLSGKELLIRSFAFLCFLCTRRKKIKNEKSYNRKYAKY